MTKEEKTQKQENPALEEALDKIDTPETKKARFVKNLIKLFIGLVLLGFSFQYVVTHPAEKTSMFSGFSIIYQKMEIFFYKLFSNEGEYLQEKYALEKTYQEMISSMEKGRCSTAQDMQKLQSKYNQLRTIDINQYKKEKLDYLDFAYKYEQKIQQLCNK